MSPKLESVDQIHAYIPNREEAAEWFENPPAFTL